MDKRINHMIYKYLQFLLFQFDPEQAHYLTLTALKTFYRPWMIKRYLQHFPKRPVSAFGLQFPNPVGLAAGLDKNGDYVDALLGLGFGFIEIGAVTPKPQLGNPKPRLLRLSKAKALINCLGFNNLGVDYFVEQLKKRKVNGVIGVNIGKNLTTSLENSYEDYRYCFEKTYPYVDYVTINVSSPNTLNLRELQSEQYLGKLLNRLKEEQCRLEDRYQRHVPFFLKISPDLTPKQLKVIAFLSVEHHLEGVIATNTTNNLQEIEESMYTSIRGGLSGKPLFPKTLAIIKQFHTLVQDAVPIIGVGGIFSPEDAEAFLKSGACLIQIYTGLIYEGPRLIKLIVSSLSE